MSTINLNYLNRKAVQREGGGPTSVFCFHHSIMANNKSASSQTGGSNFWVVQGGLGTRSSYPKGDDQFQSF